MKKNIVLLGMLSILALASCSDNKKEEAPLQPEPQPAPVEQTAPPVAKPKDGTTIKVSEQGVSYENKDAGNKQKVNVSKDSSSIEITKPK